MTTATPLGLKLGEWFWKKRLQPHLFRRTAGDAHLETVRRLKQLQSMNALPLLRYLYRSSYYQMPLKVFGTEWGNPVGLAAGFDKQLEIIRALEALGFGSIEVGTIVPFPQFGNPEPRVFRYPDTLSICNRYGFNSDGVLVIAERASQLHRFGPRVAIPIGYSIGKNAWTPNERALGDYLLVLHALRNQLRPQDWVQVNISSPNTKDLLGLFRTIEEFLHGFTEGARNVAWKLWRPGEVNERGGSFPNRYVLKLPPDNMSPDMLYRIAETAARYEFAGLEEGNTTTSETLKHRYGIVDKDGVPEVGGASGEAVRELSTGVLRDLSGAAKRLGIDRVGVGGISAPKHALEKRAAGAQAVQLYSGLVFRGPGLVHEILEVWRK
jgi:dihydroorotate dehydrogenase